MLQRIVLLVLFGFINFSASQRGSIPCYDDYGRPQRCVPPFENVAYKKTVAATNTCGTRQTQKYCLQIGSGDRGSERDTLECRECDDSHFDKSHNARFLTDFNNNDNMTWWQSETMLEGVRYPQTVNLTLHLGKEFVITYIRLRFKSSRPESMAMFKKTRDGSDWVPYQFFSSSCDETYGIRPDQTISEADETKALCTDEYSDIIPLSGANVVFSTLKGRPSAFNFDESPVLQDWVTATDIKIVLSRINTYGDEVFGYDKVLQSYFFAVSDFAIGGRCKCNGHASECTPSTGFGLDERFACNCEHNTEGINCETCKPFYNDRPWSRATATDANECRACDCNNHADRCYFDEDLYRRSGKGGHCLECRDNTAGPHCERCKDNFYRRSDLERCEACYCDPVGSEASQCDELGRCRCKPGVTGDKCDICQDNFYNFGPSGCRPCDCNLDGSLDNRAVCSQDSGNCRCKEFVEGQNCDDCKPGYFGLEAENPLGCLSCFCYGHSSVCRRATNYRSKVVHSDFSSGPQGWSGEYRTGDEVEVKYNGVIQNLAVSAASLYPVYFVAPDRYLGDQRFSYNRDLSFTLRVGEEGARPQVDDVVIEGDGLRVAAPIYSQNNPIPRVVDQEYSFTLNEHQNYQWSPSLNSREFIKLLSNVTAIRIRGTYTPQGVGFVDNVRLESARQGGSGDSVSNVEQCTCVNGYVGQFCESCAPGYHRDPENGGPLARCVPCNCNGHSDVCDVNTGQCICQHNTVGDNCERCAPGFYGYALQGTPNDCQICPCPESGECVELLNGEVACINCQEGYTGNRCEMCADGYFGEPPARPCRKCECNENVDPNAVLNCHSRTGECLKCIYNTGGYYCDQCLPGFYGDALALPKGQCRACRCYREGSYGGQGSEPVSCDTSGQCPCLSNVVGNECRECLPGYWNIASGNGCETCNCDTTGSHNTSCDITTGACECNPGVTGRRCDQCAENHFGFSSAGCRECLCDPHGSTDLQCNPYTGQCACKPNIEGKRCDTCMENKYNITAGCIDCDECYNLVQDAVNDHRIKLDELRKMLENIGDNPRAINDTDFRKKLSEVESSVNQLLEDAKASSGGDGSLPDQLEALQAALMDLMDQCGRIADDISQSRRYSVDGLIDIDAAEKAIESAERALGDAESYIDIEGQEALRRAREAQEKAGQQSARMTEIAQQARTEAGRQEVAAMDIAMTAEEALNTSREALRVARESLQMPTDTAQRIAEINRQLTSASELYELVRARSDLALQQAIEAYKQSLAIFVDANSIELPQVDAELLKEEAMKIKQKAQEIKAEAMEILELREQLMEDVANQQEEAEFVLMSGLQQQQTTDELLANADLALSIAKEAVTKAEVTLEEASETLRTLKEFDLRVKESKALAEEAQKKVPGIESQIVEAEQITAEATTNLEDAEYDANQARDTAELAKTVAEMASNDASEIKAAAGKTKEKASELREEAEDLSLKVDEEAERLKQLELQALEDERLAREALAKADSAKRSATDSSSEVQMSLRDVQEILRLLGNLPEIDETKLDDLERNLDQAELELANKDIEVKYEEILRARNQQITWVNDYTNELIRLVDDVENVRIINETIPRKCFNKLKLEPTDPSG